jgi:C4-dicarboxylate transporter DctM subunit
MAAKRPLLPLLHSLENSLSVAALVLIALLPAIEIVTRFFHTGLPASADYVQHLVLWIACLGGMVTSRENKHLALTLGIDPLKDPVRSWVAAIGAGITAAVCAMLALGSWEFMTEGFRSGARVGLLPVKALFAIMPAGFVVMALRAFFQSPRGWPYRLATALSIVVVVLIGWAVPAQGAVLVRFALGGLILSAFFGVPIFVVLGGAALLLFGADESPAAIMANEAYTMLKGPVMPTIPLFTLAGFILSESKAGERLVRLFRSLFGWLPGGLAIAAICILTFFTTLTGSSSVSLLALGGLLLFILTQSRYPERFSAGLLTVNGIGTLFPPSLPVIMYAVIAQIDIKQMFVGGLLPGSIMMLALFVISLITAARHKVQRHAFEPAEALRAAWAALGEVLIPFVILGSFFGGLTTLVETAAITVLYVLVLETAVHRDIAWHRLPDVLCKGIAIMGGVLTILCVAKGLSYYIVDVEVPMRLVDWLQTVVHSKVLFLLLLNVALLIVGCFMDIFSAIIVVVPLIVPLGAAYGIHPVHLGVIFLANLELGYLTPPVGLNLFLASYQFNKPLGEIIKVTLPFIAVLLVTVLLITYLPWLTTGLLGLVPVN